MPQPKPKPDGVRKVSHYHFPRAPKITGDVVRSRKAQVNIIDHLARGERTMQRKQYPGSVVIHTSFMLTEDLDQTIHDYALKRDCSRSAVVRQALMLYFSRVDP